MYHTSFMIMYRESVKKKLKRNIEWNLFSTGPEMLDAFRKDKIDFGYLGLSPTIIAIDKGIDIKCIAGGHIEGTIMIASKKYKNLSKLKNHYSKVFGQFIGKTIGVPKKGCMHEVILSRYLMDLDLVGKIKIKYYDVPEYIAIDLKDGIIDGAVGTPALAVFCNRISSSQIIIPTDKLWPFNPSYGIICRNEYMYNHEDIIVNFLKLHTECCSDLKAHLEQSAIEISLQLNVVNANYVKEVLSLSPKYCSALSSNYIKTTLEFVDFMKKLRYIRRIFTINDIFELKYINQVHPSPDHYNGKTQCLNLVKVK